MKHFVLVTLALVVLIGCSFQSGNVDLNSNNNGATVDASPNQMINIQLESNVTTGFKWNLVTEPDAKVVKFISSKYNGPIGGGVGAGGSETWQFQAIGKGTSALKLAYFRSFEPNTPAAREFSITVNVK